MTASLLAPVFALVLWTLVMMTWMLARRLPALKAAKLPLEKFVGGRGTDLDRILPAKVNWPAHNYAHLMEQPTIFYATVIGLALLGQATALNVMLAWTYVGLRVAHSIWQAQINTIPVRASIFFLYSVVLLVLAVNGMVAVLSA